MSDLAAKTCVPCRRGVPPLKGEELAAFERQVDGWDVIEEHYIRKAFKFPDFSKALKFINHVGELAEEQGHHPDISLAWGISSSIPELRTLRHRRLWPRPLSPLSWSNPRSPRRQASSPEG